MAESRKKKLKQVFDAFFILNEELNDAILFNEDLDFALAGAQADLYNHFWEIFYQFFSEANGEDLDDLIESPALRKLWLEK